MTKKELINLVEVLYGDGECYNVYDLVDNISECELVIEGIDIEKHRWHETSLTIYECEDGLIGIRLPSQMYQESGYWEDLYSRPEYYDVKEIVTIGYKVLNKIK